MPAVRQKLHSSSCADFRDHLFHLARCIFRRNGPTIQIAWKPPTCPPMPALRQHPIETLVAVEGRRWAIEDSFETAKSEFGLDHNESRSWHGWHRHVSLVMLAFAMMAVIESVSVIVCDRSMGG